jgi:hypothetical protein
MQKNLKSYSELEMTKDKLRTQAEVMLVRKEEC